MTDVIALTIGDRHQQTSLLVVFGSLALVIASLGLYELLTQTVSARGREIGLRMALGATWRNVARMVLSRGIVLTAAGVGIGAALAWSVTRAMGTLLYGVSATDRLARLAYSPASRSRWRPIRCGRSAANRWTPARIDGASRCASAMTSGSRPPVSH